jgi:hypothetical protein
MSASPDRNNNVIYLRPKSGEAWQWHKLGDVAEQLVRRLAGGAAMKSAKILTLPVIGIEADGLGGWLVIRWNGHGWLFGSRDDAVREAVWLNNNARGRA